MLVLYFLERENDLKIFEKSENERDERKMQKCLIPLFL